MLLTSCGDSSTSFQEEMQKQRDFENETEKNKTITEEQAEEYAEHMTQEGILEYNEAMDKYMSEDVEDIDLTKESVYWTYTLYEDIKEMAIPISVGSVIVGFLLRMLCRGNKRIQGFGVFGLMIGVPAIMLFLVYGLGIMKGIFMGS